jgi:hypothetical protein
MPNGHKMTDSMQGSVKNVDYQLSVGWNIPERGLLLIWAIHSVLLPFSCHFFKINIIFLYIYLITALSNGLSLMLSVQNFI